MAASKMAMRSPSGKCRVRPPSTPGTSRFLRRRLPRVSCVSARSLPRREREELRSEGWMPPAKLPAADGDLVPGLVAVKDVGVASTEELGGQGSMDYVVDIALIRPDLAQVDRLAVGAKAQRLAREVNQHGPGQRVGNDQRRRSQVAGPHVGVDAPFEVAVAGKDGGRHESGFCYGALDRSPERTAAVAGGG